MDPINRTYVRTHTDVIESDDPVVVDDRPSRPVVVTSDSSSLLVVALALAIVLVVALLVWHPWAP